jgi:uncharacterized membrane protein YqaE (UPF0057 family)
MNLFKMALAVLMPPLAVWDKGCGTVLLVSLLTLLLWIPGAVAAMIIIVRDMQRTSPSSLAQTRSTGIFNAAQDLKGQPLGSSSPNAPFDPAPPFASSPAASADPFAASSPPVQRPPSPFQDAPSDWEDAPPAPPADPFDEPGDTNPPPPQPPARPKPPWEA